MINEQIRDKEVRLIGEDGEQLGIVSSRDALKMAEEAGLDLVKIAPTAKPPVCKIVDYGKYKYEQVRKENKEEAEGHRYQGDQTFPQYRHQRSEYQDRCSQKVPDQGRQSEDHPEIPRQRDGTHEQQQTYLR